MIDRRTNEQIARQYGHRLVALLGGSRLEYPCNTLAWLHTHDYLHITENAYGRSRYELTDKGRKLAEELAR